MPRLFFLGISDTTNSTPYNTTKLIRRVSQGITDSILLVCNSLLLISTGRAHEHEGKLMVLMIMLSCMWALPTTLYPSAPPCWYRSGVSQLPTNPLNKDKS